MASEQRTEVIKCVADVFDHLDCDRLRLLQRTGFSVGEPAEVPSVRMG